ncbi:motile sperm domain-containing protein 2-like isoform X2 [Ruditapes philippinarum]|uniref:motile sperm domain-containing protein 2-like isoform X2 n=1 Tax=Ruditapes philippinarum TaxID=129788 RepID=UPI00295B0EB6|nr:motile sperm domain-containing protein 2-like isoform X2 [Ruditapes philippinarum]
MAEGGKDETVEEKSKKLRDLFLSKHSGDIEAGHYDDRDVKKFNEDDAYVASFIRTYETLQEAANHLHESLKFRLEYGVNDLKEDNFPQEMWETGAMYYHNHDKDGIPILYIQVKQHVKDPQLLPTIKKWFAYHLEKQYLKDPESSIVLLFDLDGAGMAQIDMEFVKHIINSFKLYYPKLLEYMLVYEMPWLFSAAWKLIKQMLNAESVKRIKFVTKTNVQEYINKDQLLGHMGGTDPFVYKYEPPCFDVGGGGDELDEPDSETPGKKKVTFAEEDNKVYRSLSSDSLSTEKLNGNNNSNTNASNSILRQRLGPPSKHKRQGNREDNSYIGRLLTISPAEELEFLIEEGVKEPCDIITLKNTLPYSIAYKVKTTSPEKYRVRPSSGFIKSGTEIEVYIHLQQGYQNTVQKDKFLIMAMEVTNESNRSFSELWKSVQKDSIMEHRLRCIATIGKDTGIFGAESRGGPTKQAVTELSKKVDSLVECNNHLQKTVKYLIVTHVILLTVLLVVAIVTLYMWYINDTQGAQTKVGIKEQFCSDSCL